MRRLPLVVGLLVLAGCAPRQTNVIQVNIQAPGQLRTTLGPVTLHKFALSFAGGNAIIARRFANLADRTTETAVLTDRAIVRYTKMKMGTFPGDFSDAQALRFDMAMPFFIERGVRYAPAAVRTSGPFAYIIAGSETSTCFLFHANFGSGGGRGDQQVTGNYCAVKTNRTADSIAREMLDYMARLRLDGAPIQKD